MSPRTLPASTLILSPLKTAGFFLGSTAVAIVVAGCTPAEPEKNEAEKQASSAAEVSSEMQKTDEEPLNVYIHNRYGFKMTLPPGWTAKEGNLAGGLDGSPPLPSLYDGKTATYITFSPQTKTVFHFSVTTLDALSSRSPQVVFHGNIWFRSVVDGGIWYHIVPPFAPHIYYLFQTTSDQEAVVKQILSTFEFTMAPKKIESSNNEKTAPTAIGPTETFVKMSLEIQKVKTYGDYEAFVLKYMTKKGLAVFQAQSNALSEEEKDQEISKVKTYILSSEKITNNIQENINGSTATLTAPSGDGDDFSLITLELENNQWKVSPDDFRRLVEFSL